MTGRMTIPVRLSRLIGMAALILAFSLPVNAQRQRMTYNLSDLLTKKSFTVENRRISGLTEKNGVRLSADNGAGVAWINNASFSNGTIEADLRGKDIRQRSFIGIAFHGASKEDCEVIYFRPFNFHAKDSLASMHMVQYVQDTLYGWERLREEHPGVYENRLAAPPAPNDWFHVKIDVQGKAIKVYVNNEKSPCLQVTSLGTRTSGKLGLWVGNNAEGDFGNLVVAPR